MRKIFTVVLAVAAAAAVPARAGMAPVEASPERLVLSVPVMAVQAGPALAPALTASVPSASLCAPSLSVPAAFAAAVSAAAPTAASAPQAAAIAFADAPSAQSPSAGRTSSAPMPALARGAAAAAAAAAAENGFDASAVFDGARTQAAATPSAPSAPRMAGELIPAWAGEELPIASARLGRPLTPEQQRGVMARTNVWVYRWHSYFTYEVSGGLPDGHFDRRFGIRLMLKTNWRRLKDPQTHFRVLMAHEYTHWLQDEGIVSKRYGVETAAVAAEFLRGVELVGLDGLRQGRVDFIHEGVLGSFENGRRWAHGDGADDSIFYYRGALGGAAYEVGLIAGRPEAAWEFLNLVIAQKGALSPREALARVTGRAK